MNADGSKQTRVTNHGARRAPVVVAGLEADRVRQRADREAAAAAVRRERQRLGARMLSRGAMDMSPDWARG